MGFIFFVLTKSLRFFNVVVIGASMVVLSWLFFSMKYSSSKYLLRVWENLLFCHTNFYDAFTRPSQIK